ncbi:hypothetical protein [Nitratiruptor tergarcus]|nr:hypothetical protein [Nitratiruptor tergarcus]
MYKRLKRLNKSIKDRQLFADRLLFSPSFTLIEVIFVIIVIGILAAMVLPRFQKNDVVDAAHQILSHIRYTQHLAIIDDKFNPTKSDWYKELWQIRFFKKKKASSDGSTAKWGYAIFSDKNSGSGYDGNPNATTGEVAKDPLTGKLISGGFTINYTDKRTLKQAAIEETYKIVDVRFSPSCSYRGSKRIVFDNQGRPLIGDPQSYISAYTQSKILQQQCEITFCFYDNSCKANFKIAIEPETGFSYISSMSF